MYLPPAMLAPAIRPCWPNTKPTMAACPTVVSAPTLAPCLTTVTVPSTPASQPSEARNFSRAASDMNISTWE